MAKLYSVFLCLLAIQCILTMTAAVNEPNIDVHPINIHLGITSTLNINCSFSMNTKTAMVGLVSLILSRANSSGQNFKKIAAIPIDFAPHSVALEIRENVTATGVHNAMGESFMYLSWEYPTETQAGVYQCSAHGLDTLGNNLEAVNTSMVTASKADINDVFEVLKEMQKEISYLRSTVATLKQFQPMNFLGTYQNTDYYLSRPGIGNYHAIIDVCKSYGGHLLEINDENEDKAVQEFLRATTGFNRVLIGGTDDETEGTWLLPSTNKPLPYTNWWTDEPDNDENEMCLMLARYRAWHMTGEGCNFQLPPRSSPYTYACEIPRH